MEKQHGLLFKGAHRQTRVPTTTCAGPLMASPLVVAGMGYQIHTLGTVLVNQYLASVTFIGEVWLIGWLFGWGWQQPVARQTAALRVFVAVLQAEIVY